MTAAGLGATGLFAPSFSSWLCSPHQGDSRLQHAVRIYSSDRFMTNLKLLTSLAC